jgi:hypothetical protein
MIEVVDRTDNAVRMKAAGKLTASDYEQVVIPTVESVLEKNEKVNVQIEFSGDYEGTEIGAMWQDDKFGWKHRKEFGKVSVVGAPKWMEWGAKVGGKLTSADLKTFPGEQADDAWDWVTH